MTNFNLFVQYWFYIKTDIREDKVAGNLTQYYLHHIDCPRIQIFICSSSQQRRLCSIDECHLLYWNENVVWIKFVLTVMSSLINSHFVEVDIFLFCLHQCNSISKCSLFNCVQRKKYCYHLTHNASALFISLRSVRVKTLIEILPSFHPLP